jgi:ribonucleotide reductase beta subunit family protein with ferritin-like domain
MFSGQVHSVATHAPSGPVVVATPPYSTDPSLTTAGALVVPMSQCRLPAGYGRLPEEAAGGPGGADAADAATRYPHTDPADYRRWVGSLSPAGAHAEMDAAEPLLRDDPDRHALFPLRDPEAWEFRKLIERLRWSAHEVRIDRDRADADALEPEYRALIERVLGFFGMADERILEGLDEVFTSSVELKEFQHYLRAVSEQESVHSEAYSIQIQQIVPPERQAEVFQAVETMPAVGRMADWMRYWVRGEHAFADRVLAAAFNEGVLFSAQFAIIQNTKAMNLMEGLTTFNEFISRDEGVHTRTWCFILRKRIVRRPDAAVAHAVARETVALCRAFVEEALPAPAGGLTVALLVQHIESVADSVLELAGYPPLYRVASPFRFMDALALNAIGKTNFFEGDVSQYQAPPDPEAYRFAINSTPIPDSPDFPLSGSGLGE